MAKESHRYHRLHRNLAITDGGYVSPAEIAEIAEISKGTQIPQIAPKLGHHRGQGFISEHGLNGWHGCFLYPLDPVDPWSFF